jgi:hypothetical protein
MDFKIKVESNILVVTSLRAFTDFEISTLENILKPNQKEQLILGKKNGYCFLERQLLIFG